MQPINLENESIQIIKRAIVLRIRNPEFLSVTETKTELNTETDSPIQEVWKEIGLEYPGYCASSLGRIKGLKGKIFNCKPMEQGYVQCAIITNHGQRVTRKAHILVATAFIPNPQNKPIVNHKNGIRHDNRVINLEWATHSENGGSMKLSQVKGYPRRSVIQYAIHEEPIQVWDSVSEAAYAASGDVASMSRACRTKTIYRGYQWRYYDEMVKPQNEEWKSLVYNGVTVQVSNLGRIRGASGGIIGSDVAEGYIRINLNGNTVLAHRLICMAWKPIANPELYVVNHIDNNGKNNRIENLEWVTRGDNNRHYSTNFRIYDSSNRGRPVKQLSIDGKILIATFGSAKEASEKTAIAASNISATCQGNRNMAGGFVWQYS
jgi:hypothetical protein